MNWATKTRGGERLIEVGAPVVLAAAVGWAVAAVSGAVIAGFGAAAVAMAAGVAAMRRVGVAEPALGLPDYVIEPIDDATRDELLLDDPLAAVAADSRVSMFERDEEAATPGALVARIADYLDERGGDDRRQDRLPADAGAALHVALANIRASLR